MSEEKASIGPWSTLQTVADFWNDLKPGMLLKVEPTAFGNLGVFRVDAWGNVHADGAQSIVSAKHVLVVRVGTTALWFDFILGDSIWRIHNQEYLKVTLNSSQASLPLSGNPPFQDIPPCNPPGNQVELGCEEEKATAS